MRHLVVVGVMLAGSTAAAAPVPRWVVELPIPDVAVPPDVEEVWALLDIQRRHEPGLDAEFRREVVIPQTDEVAEEYGLNLIAFSPEIQKVQFHYFRVTRDGTRFDALADATLDRSDGDLSVQVQGLRGGDLLDYAYTITTRRAAGPVWGQEPLGWANPVARVHYRVSVAHGQPLHAKILGPGPQPLQTEAGGRDEYVWDLQPSAGRSPAADTPGWHQVWPIAVYSSLGAWEQLADLLAPEFAPPASPGPALLAVIEQIRAAHSDSRGRFDAAVRYVQDVINPLFMPTYQPPREVELVLTAKQGTSFERARLLVALLRGLEIAAVPALAHSLHQGYVAEWEPMPEAFNTAIVKAEVDGETLWIDPAVTLQQEYLPLHYQRALLLVAGAGSLVELPEPSLPEPDIVITERYEIAGDTAELRVKTVAIGAQANNLRRRFVELSVAELEQAFAAMYNEYDPELTKQEELTVQDDEQRNRIVLGEHYRTTDFWKDGRREFWPGEVLANLVYPQEGPRSDPLALSYPAYVRQQVTVHNPAGFTIVPESHEEANEFFTLTMRAKMEGDKTVQVTWELQVHRDHVLPAELVRYRAALARAEEFHGYHVTTELELGSGGPGTAGWAGLGMLAVVLLAGTIASIRDWLRHRGN